MRPSDQHWMRQALRLAEKGWGRTTPNPMVGAVVVHDGVLAGSGWHRRAGQPHAEPEALAAAGRKAQNATLYVTLEPCCTQGRTPPCTTAILAAGIRRVVVGCLDPNPKHAGRGIEILRQAGVEVVIGVEEKRCRELNRAFFHWITTRRPLVLLKMAMTLDGRIATADGDSQWITGPIARRRVQRLRQWADAILVGGETVRRDDPSLTVRTPQAWPFQPRKMVWTRRPESTYAKELKIFADSSNLPEFVALRTPQAWRDWLAELGGEGVTALLLEGGGELAGAALQAGAVDRIEFHIAPKILGGRGSRPVVGGSDPLRLAEALGLHDVALRRLGDDFCLTGALGTVPEPKAP